jgi:predicted DNA binding protein
VPAKKSVGEFMDTFRNRYPEAELVAKSQREKNIRTRSGFKAELENSLTRRQLETLQTAYFGGYFEWPRESSTEEIADMLGVTHPTISRHLREGQRRLFAEIFDGE